MGLTGPITGTNSSTMYLQGIVVGPDGMIYVANNSALGGTDQVLQINPSNDSLTWNTFSTSASGATALGSGSYKGTDGVFVGNLTYAGTGSIDFINTSAASITQVLSSKDTA